MHIGRRLTALEEQAAREVEIDDEERVAGLPHSFIVARYIADAPLHLACAKTEAERQKIESDVARLTNYLPHAVREEQKSGLLDEFGNVNTENGHRSCSRALKTIRFLGVVQTPIENSPEGN